ncbi:MAG: hypothetical protein FWH28_01370, partial [Clostridiales bacterium]|nr:hypothetical protein [Clostridiales bacterium]
MEVKTKMTARILVLALMMLMALGLMPGGLLLPAAVAVEPGVPDAPTRAQVSSLRFIEAETNYLGGIALDSNGYVWTWGYNAYGMLGTGKSVGDYAGGMARVPYFMDNNIKIVQVEGGYHTNYALDDQGVLYAWGRGLEGQMGNYTTSINNNTPQIVTSLEGIKIKKVATTTEAASATFAIDVDGNVYAWGYADGYRINGWSGYQREARRMPEFDAYNVVDIVLGNQHGIVLDSAGQIYTWGYNTSGQLGHGNRTLQQTPVQVSFFSGMVVKGISAEFNTSMAVTSDGRAWTWGTNYEATATSRMTSYTSAGGGTYNYWPSGRENQILTPEWIQFDLSSSPYNTVAPPIATVTAGRYTSYLTDVYGRVWVIGWNVHYGLLTDGPLFTTTNGGKHSVYVKDATLIRTLGDGDTQGYLNEPAGPVFSGATSTSNFLAQYNSYNRFGQWSQMGDGLHPTIYDKKYMNTTDSGDPRSHTYDYPLDALGRRLVYVIRRESASPITYGGNFYVAEPGYSGPWCVNNSSRTDLPAGVTTVTSVPSVKSEEQGWINLVVDVDSFDYTGGYLKELPYIKQITTYQSQVLFLDNAGNLYKQSFDGSGSIAWGWDYGKYEIGTAGNNAARGLYNFYFYELMYMRGAPTADFTDIDAQRASSKIYLVEDAEGNTPVDTVTISAKVPPIVTSAALNLSLEPELTELRYLFIPYDETNSYFGMTSFSDSEFNAAASSGLYQTGSLLTPGATYKDGNYTFSVNIPNNGKLWLLIGDSLYGSVSYHSYIYLADNFYTPIEAMHRGVEEENPPGRQVYAPTAENVVKTSTDPAGVKPAQPPVYYGLPLDVNGNVISDPSYGYDEISITKLAVLPNGLDDRWEFITPQDETVVYELDNASFVTYDAGGVLTPFVHEFYYLFTGFPILTSDKSVTDENGDGYASPGETLTYVITIGNVGTAPGEDILVKDTLEDILPYVNDPSGNVVTIENDGVLSTVTVQDLIDGFEIPEVVDATVATITFSVKVKTSFDAGAVTKLFNQAEVGDTDPPAAEIETLGVFKDADVLRISELTDLITYTIRFRMPADVTAYESVRIVDIIPDALRYAVGSTTLSIGGAARPAGPGGGGGKQQ